MLPHSDKVSHPGVPTLEWPSRRDFSAECVMPAAASREGQPPWSGHVEDVYCCAERLMYGDTPDKVSHPLVAMHAAALKYG